MNFGLDRKLLVAAASAVLLLVAFDGDATQDGKSSAAKGGSVELGRFSVSLSVKDLKTSREFYEKLGFVRVDGSKPTDKQAPGQDWIILQNGSAIIGLFQGMFEGNIMTFNPTDIRTLKAALDKRGLTLDLQNMYGPVTANSPAYAILKDPDGNTIYLDQHGTTK